MNISIRLEGGLGDHLLANRFVHAINEKYKKDNLKIYSDTDGNQFQLNFLKKYWPSLYKNAVVAPERKNKTFSIKSQFGEEIYNAALENQDEIVYKGYDKFIDLCLDRLEWLNADFDWARYFYFFPSPEIQPNGEKENSFILANLFSRPSSPYSLDKKYLINLIEEVRKIEKIIIVTTEENKHYYDGINFENVEIRVADLDEVFYLSSQCKAFLGIDSGIRCMPYYFGKPTFYFSTFCKQYGDVLPAYLLRWVIFDKNVFPMHYNINYITHLLNVAIQKRAGFIFPYLNLQNFDNIIIKRDYIVNENYRI